MQITVATLQFGAPPYFRYAEAINRQYCRTHGYGFEIIKPPRQIRRSPIWFKVDGVKRLLSVSSLILFLDADAYFVDPSRRIESLVDEHMGSAALLLGTDRRDKAFAWSDENANCGVFVVRQCKDALEILTSWWNVPLDVDRQWLWRWPSEQGAFNQHVLHGRYADKIRVIPYHHLNGVDGLFIRHLMGFSDDQRLLSLRRDAAQALTSDSIGAAETNRTGIDSSLR